MLVDGVFDRLQDVTALLSDIPDMKSLFGPRRVNLQTATRMIHVATAQVSDIYIYIYNRAPRAIRVCFASTALLKSVIAFTITPCPHTLSDPVKTTRMDVVL